MSKRQWVNPEHVAYVANPPSTAVSFDVVLHVTANRRIEVVLEVWAKLVEEDTGAVVGANIDEFLAWLQSGG